MAKSDGTYVGKGKPSLLPFVAVVLIPIVCLVVGGMLIISKQPEEVAPAPEREEVYITIAVAVHDGEGNGIAGKSVTMTPDAEGGEVQTLATDSGGYAMGTFPKKGNVSIQVEGKDAPVKLRDLQRTAGITTEITVVLNETEMKE